MDNRYAALLSKLQDPLFFMHNVLGENITAQDVLEGRADRATAPTEAQQAILRSVRDNKRTCVQACHSVGKSYIACRIALWFNLAFKPSIVLTTAPKQMQVRSILWAGLQSAHARSKVALGGDMYVGSYYPKRDKFPNWFALGMTARTGEAFQGFHSEHMLLILDEASGIPDFVFDACEGMLSTDNTKILEIGNPTSNLGRFAEHCKQPQKHKYNCIKLSAYGHENVKHQRTLYRGAVAPDWPEERKQVWGADSPLYRVRVMGEFPLQDENAIIPLHLIEHAVNRGVDSIEDYKVAYGVDVAREGLNQTAVVRRIGRKFEVVFTEDKSNLMDLCNRLYAVLCEHELVSVCIDEVGLGSGVVDRMREMAKDFLGRCTIYPFSAGGTTDTKKKIERRKRRRTASGVQSFRSTRLDTEDERLKFKNLSTEQWWRFRELLQKTYDWDQRNETETDRLPVGISLPQNDELIYQLSMRQYKAHDDVLELVQKKDMDIPMDIADATIMCQRAFDLSYPESKGNFAPRGI